MHIRRIRRTSKDYYNILFDFETITSGAKHQPYLSWIYSGCIQQEFPGINHCVIDMLNNLPTDKHKSLLIAHNSDHDCIFSLEYLQHVKPVVKSNRCLQIKATYYNTVHKHEISIVVTYIP